MLSRLAIMLAVLALAACSSKTTSLQRNITAANLPVVYSQQQGSQQLAGNWWQSFGDRQLETLLANAEQNNYDVRIAQSYVEQAKAGITGATADHSPRLYVNGGGRKETTTYPDIMKQQGIFDKEGPQAAVDLSWNIDVFGVGRAARLASVQTLTSSQWGKQATIMMMRQNVADQYLQLQAAYAKELLITALIAEQTLIVQATNKRLAVGLASAMEQNTEQNSLRQMQAQLQDLQSLITASQMQLSLLSGTPAKLSISPQGQILQSAVNAQPIPVGQPVELLARRPDIQMAEFELQAEGSKLKQAKRSRLPQLFLSLVYGEHDLQLTPILFQPDPVRFLNAALSFALPVFDKRLKAALQGQTAKEKTALLKYEKTVLGALYQVDTLIAVRNNAQRKVTLLQAHTQAQQDTANRAAQLLQKGLANSTTLARAKQALLHSQLALIDANAAQSKATIDLFTALGGQWQLTPVGANQANATNQAAISQPAP